MVELETGPTCPTDFIPRYGRCYSHQFVDEEDCKEKSMNKFARVVDDSDIQVYTLDVAKC